MTAPLLVEIGCEEIPARMIPGAAADLGRAVEAILDRAGLPRGAASAWGGTRRLAVRVEDVAARQADREELVLGPPSRAAFAADGAPTPALVGFARKQGIDPAALAPVETDRGTYAGFRRAVPGRGLGEILAAALPEAVAGMSFPKTMRWGEGRHRWVRPVHWVLALHGAHVLPLELFGVASAGASRGHRFLHGDRDVPVAHPDAHAGALLAAKVVSAPGERRRRLEEALRREAAEAGGELVDDPALLDEIADLVEWPGVVAGRFDPAFLDLPREILVTTLRHHQKAFSVRGPSGLLPVFLAVANTDRDPGGHVRRGNEWVVSGRLEDARFFWNEDRKVRVLERFPELQRVAFHRAVGTIADRVRRCADLAEALAARLGQDPSAARRAAEMSKNDLVTGLVGEFPELQGIVGGLLLRAEGEDEAVAAAVYEHYAPAGAEDACPDSPLGAALAAADKLSLVAALVDAGEAPTGSRDPLGLRRAANGAFRIVLERGWPLSLRDLHALSGAGPAVLAFLSDRLGHHLRDAGATANEVRAVQRPQVDAEAWTAWPLPDVAARVRAIRAVRGREDFGRLVALTRRADNILVKEAGKLAAARARAEGGFEETEPAAAALGRLLEASEPEMEGLAARGEWAALVDRIAGFIEPVERYFTDVLVVDPDRPAATAARAALVERLRDVLTAWFDIRELAGEAAR